MPYDAARYRGSKAARYRRWLRRLTLWQYALFVGVVCFIAAFVTATLVTAADAWPGVHRSWASNLVMAAVLTVMLTTFFTWQRREDLRQDRDGERPPGQSDQ